MALTYDGTGGLFTRLGKLVKMMDAVRTHQNNLKTLLAGVQGEYSSADSYMIAAVSGSIEARIVEAGGILLDIQKSAETTLIEMCFAEANPSSSNSMKNRTVEDALVWLIRQMLADSETVDGTTITIGATAVGASNTGNGSLVLSAECPNILLSGTTDFPNCRSELITVRCMQDAQDGSIRAGQEVFDAIGQPSYVPLDYRFPAGSGRTTRIVTACAEIDNGPQYQNILTNSDFEDQTSNLPAQWSLVSGTAGTDFLTETSTVYRGASSIRLAATGVAMKIRQQLGVVGGTFGKLTPDRPYVISFASYLTAGGTGTVRVSLQDAGGSVLGSFALSVAHGSMTAGAWKQHSVALYSPRVIGSTVYVVLETTTAVATQPIFVDEVIIAEMVPHTPSGPFLAVLAGSANWNVDDNIRSKIANNAEGDFNLAFERFFDMQRRALALPANYAGSETIADSLTT
jgi:hypothetical protein